MHGHNWKLEVEVTADALNEQGMAVDFKALKGSAQDLCAQLDHHYLNDIPPFDQVNPTAENLAAFFYHGLSKKINDKQVQVSAITLWETERACVRYTEERQA